MSEVTHQGSYRPEIDGLRAIAVVAVLIFHLDHAALSGGFLGVDVFFVISGFLITRLLLAEVESGAPLRTIAARFYRRRVLRILPLYAVVSLSCLVVGWFLLLPTDFARTVRTALYGAVFQSNRVLFETTMYFSPGADSEPLLHTWSLSIEEQFYLLWPVALFAISRWLGARRVAVVVLVTCALVVVSQLLAVGSDIVSGGQAYFMLRARAYEPLIGAGVAVYLHHHPATQIRIPGMGLVGLVVMIASFGLVDRSLPVPGFAALGATVGTAAVILSPRSAHAVLALRPLVWVGKISYSLYLVHWPVLCFVRYVGISIGLYEAAWIVPGCLVLSYACYRWIEQPLRYRAWSLWSSLAVLVVIPLAVIGGLRWRAATTDDFADRLSAGAHHTMAAMLQFAHQNGCHGAPVDAIARCGLGAPGPATSVLWGDSHANHYTGLFDVVGKRRGEAIHEVSGSACPPTLDARDVSTYCLERNEAVVSWLSVNPQIRTVYLAGAWSQVNPRGLTTTVAMLNQRGRRVVILTEVLALPVEKVDCPIKARFYDWFSLSCSFPDRTHQRDTQLTPLLRDLAERYGVSIIDVVGLMCDGTTCRQELEDVPLYRKGDRGHLNLEGSRALGRALVRASSPPLP